MIGLAIGIAPASAGAATAPSEPPAPVADGDAIVAARLAALDEAGYGALFADGFEYPGQPDGVPWPTQSWPMGPVPDGVDVVALEQVIATAFAPQDVGIVEAVVAVVGGRLVLNVYNEWDPAEPHHSWSMAKSFTQAMLGVLVDGGALDIWGPAPVPEWSDPADPRHAITIDDLLHMRSGLQWNEEYSGTSDVVQLVAPGVVADRAHYAASKPLVDEPGSTFYYSTGSSAILARVVADQVGYGEAGIAWADEHLFAPIGITTVQHNLDATGVMSGGSNFDMTALDFARFGYLYLRGGRWDGRQVVPEAWVDYARMPIADTPEYGAHWWVPGTDPAYLERFPTMFAARGFGGQRLYVIPELDTVLLVLSNNAPDLADETMAGLIEAFAGVAP